MFGMAVLKASVFILVFTLINPIQSSSSSEELGDSGQDEGKNEQSGKVFGTNNDPESQISSFDSSSKEVNYLIQNTAYNEEGIGLEDSGSTIYDVNSGSEYSVEHTMEQTVSSGSSHSGASRLENNIDSETIDGSQYVEGSKDFDLGNRDVIEDDPAFNQRVENIDQESSSINSVKGFEGVSHGTFSDTPDRNYNGFNGGSSFYLQSGRSVSDGFNSGENIHSGGSSYGLSSFGNQHVGGGFGGLGGYSGEFSKGLSKHSGRYGGMFGVTPNINYNELNGGHSNNFNFQGGSTNLEPSGTNILGSGEISDVSTSDTNYNGFNGISRDPSFYLNSGRSVSDGFNSGDNIHSGGSSYEGSSLGLNQYFGEGFGGLGGYTGGQGEFSKGLSRHSGRYGEYLGGDFKHLGEQSRNSREQGEFSEENDLNTQENSRISKGEYMGYSKEHGGYIGERDTLGNEYSGGYGGNSLGEFSRHFGVGNNQYFSGSQNFGRFDQENLGRIGGHLREQGEFSRENDFNTKVLGGYSGGLGLHGKGYGGFSSGEYNGHLGGYGEISEGYGGNSLEGSGRHFGVGNNQYFSGDQSSGGFNQEHLGGLNGHLREQGECSRENGFNTKGLGGYAGGYGGNSLEGSGRHFGVGNNQYFSGIQNFEGFDQKHLGGLNGHLREQGECSSENGFNTKGLGGYSGGHGGNSFGGFGHYRGGKNEYLSRGSGQSSRGSDQEYSDVESSNNFGAQDKSNKQSESLNDETSSNSFQGISSGKDKQASQFKESDYQDGRQAYEDKQLSSNLNRGSSTKDLEVSFRDTDLAELFDKSLRSGSGKKEKFKLFQFIKGHSSGEESNYNKCNVNSKSECKDEGHVEEIGDGFSETEARFRRSGVNRKMFGDRNGASGRSEKEGQYNLKGNRLSSALQQYESANDQRASSTNQAVTEKAQIAKEDDSKKLEDSEEFSESGFSGHESGMTQGVEKASFQQDKNDAASSNLNRHQRSQQIENNLY